ncbi:MAG: hypothetical protein R3297_05875 [Desulfobulbales bacterium]|nr:hypothetical protein [Desulfobulbales bacterium]
MTDIRNENLENSEIDEITPEDVEEEITPESVEDEIPPEDEEMETLAQNHGEESQAPSDNFREASYVVLFIAAIFVINAMETGSYRTPWPVAIITAIVGFGLLGYSLFSKPRTG